MSTFDPSWCARLHAARTPPAPPSAATGTPYRLREVPAVHDCECCGVRMYDHHCKILCPNCGYKRDCSDP
jgi:Zn finger protein HypA/HybF involved in hydrogenase expression